MPLNPRVPASLEHCHPGGTTSKLHRTIQKSKSDPTKRIYNAFGEAYDFFNLSLFKGKLPRCIITLQRKSRTYGYFSGDRWQQHGARKITDEIALNPRYFYTEPVEEILTTLVHEMAHLWQHHFGRPSRGGYHNKEWGAKMKSVGLMPSNTGKPGGKQTGQQMMDYPIPGGPFLQMCKELIEEHGFCIPYWDRACVKAQVPAENNGIEFVFEPDKSKQKYSCTSCRISVWGKGGLRIMCVDCSARLVTAR